MKRIAGVGCLVLLAAVGLALLVPPVRESMVGVLWVAANALPPAAPPASATAPARPTPSPPPTATATPRPSLPGLPEIRSRAVSFLKSQYDEGWGLLRESPSIGWNNLWLTNDNALAAYTLERLGERGLAERLRASLKRYGYEENGFIELVWGKAVAWPPNHHQDLVVATSGKEQVKQETHLGPGYFYDWSAFSNLAFMAAINEHNLGYHESARRLYLIEAAKFDGLGWQDKAWADRGGIYETIGLTWGLLAAGTVGEAAPPELVEGLLKRQGPSGGFHTHYTAKDERLADPNVETTCLALLALEAYFR